MSKLMNVSSSPHVRSKLTTRHVMCDVILAFFRRRSWAYTILEFPRL